MKLEEIYKKLEGSKYKGMSVSKQTRGKIHLYSVYGHDGFWISKIALNRL